ncbi:MAG: S8 family peptidase [Bacteroidia bacterium]|nr:S8 family peptidase [Bacteroidia bacterium]
MKIFLLSFAFISSISCLWAQQKQNPISTNIYKNSKITVVKQTNNIGFTKNTGKMPNKEVLKKQQRTTINTNAKQIVQKNEIHWYALENENNTLYWSNVDCKNIIIELQKGISIESKGIKDFLQKNNLTKIVRKSKYPEIQNFYQFEVIEGNKKAILQIVNSAKLNPNILYVEPISIIKTNAFTPNDPYWNQQWGPYVIGADSVWSYYTGGTSNTKLAVIDNAVDWYHPDLYDNVWDGYDFANNDNDPTPDVAFASYQEHGTHVTGTIGATLNNGIGVSGMINDTVYFAKIGKDSTLSDVAVIDALNYISTVAHIRAVNMSFGGPSQSSALETAINNAWNNGKLLIAAAGNSNSSNPLYPAAFTNVISVSAVGVSSSYDFTCASYSNFGSTIDLSAPGGEASTGFPIISTLPNNTYGGANWQGTSMAAPHVTGLAGIVFDMNPFLTNAQARTIIEQQVFDLGASGWDQYFGTGMICAYCSYFEACNQLSANIATSGNLSFCEGGNVTFTCDYNDNVKYQWTFNGANISSATSNLLTANQSGSYNLVLTTPGGCQATWNPFIVTVNQNPPSPTISTNGSTTFCQGGSVILSAPSGYSWYNWSNGVNGPTNQDLTVTTTGSYSLNVANSNWCNSPESSPVWVQVNPLPPTPTISQNGNQLISDATTGNQWYLDGNIIPGATNQTYNITSAGNYYVISTNNGCSSNISNAIYSINVEEISLNNNFAVYPNPVNHELFIETLKSNSKLKFEIINSIGQIVYSSFVDKKVVVNISYFANGIYDLNIYDGQTIYTKRFIKE